MSPVNKKILDKVLLDLNITPEQILEEGLFTGLGTKIANMGRAVGRGAVAPVRGAVNAAGSISNTMGQALQTKDAIVKTGLLFKGPKGDFIGISGIDPNSKQAEYFTKQQGLKGYAPADANDRIKAMASPVNIQRGNDITANLKVITVQAMKDIATVAQKLQAEASSKQTLSSPEAGGMYKQLNQAIMQGIKAAQDLVGGQQAPAPGLVPLALPVPPAPRIASVAWQSLPPWCTDRRHPGHRLAGGLQSCSLRCHSCADRSDA